MNINQSQVNTKTPFARTNDKNAANTTEKNKQDVIKELINKQNKKENDQRKDDAKMKLEVEKLKKQEREEEMKKKREGERQKKVENE